MRIWNGLVVDADGHVDDHLDLAGRLPEKYRPLAPIEVVDQRGRRRLLLEGRLWSNSEGPAPGVQGPFTERARKSRPGMTDPVARLKDMDEEGIDVALLFGTQVALSVNGLMDKGLAGALCRAVNEWLAEYCSADPRRLRGVGLIPCQDPPAAAAEVERLAREGAVAAMLPTNVYGINLGDERFDPIYAAAQEAGLPLCVHPDTGHTGVYGVSGVMGAGTERLFKYVYVHLTQFPFECMIALMHMVGEGVFDRFPRLKVAFCEGGIGWLPFWAERMDEHVEKLAPQMPKLQRKPTEIIRSGQVAFTFEPEEAMLPAVLEFIGPQAAMYASDYCHWDCMFPDSVREVAGRSDLTEEQKRRVFSENAVRFFGLSDLAGVGQLPTRKEEGA